jgi:hypothetical protein
VASVKEQDGAPQHLQLPALGTGRLGRARLGARWLSWGTRRNRDGQPAPALASAPCVSQHERSAPGADPCRPPSAPRRRWGRAAGRRSAPAPPASALSRTRAGRRAPAPGAAAPRPRRGRRCGRGCEVGRAGEGGPGRAASMGWDGNSYPNGSVCTARAVPMSSESSQCMWFGNSCNTQTSRHLSTCNGGRQRRLDP